MAMGWPGGLPCTPNSLFEQWDALVREVDEGYGWSAPELANDLWCRSALDRIWPSLPPMGWDDLTFPGPAEVEIVD
ncbi:hypothetical protein [Streptomyces virginiae]|uniref:hypothetical protein n=1 Tax=Streptomyces virginiae TaxID=1961 RepID=UPI00379E1233